MVKFGLHCSFWKLYPQSQFWIHLKFLSYKEGGIFLLPWLLHHLNILTMNFGAEGSTSFYLQRGKEKGRGFSKM